MLWPLYPCRWRKTGVGLEIACEEGHIGELEFGGNLLKGHGGGAQTEFELQDDIFRLSTVRNRTNRFRFNTLCTT